MIVRDDLLEQFLVEGRELVARGNAELSAVGGGERIDGLFRTLHTLKGSAALFDLPQLTAMLHAAETLLEGARGGDGLVAEADVAQVLDLTDGWLDVLDAEGEAPARLLEQTAVVTAQLGGGSAPAVSAALDIGETPAWARELGEAAAMTRAAVAVRYTPGPDAYFRGDDPLAVVRGLPGLAVLRLETGALAPPGEDYDVFRCDLRLLALCAAPAADVRAALRLVIDQVELVTIEPQGLAPAELALRSLRVDARKLDAVAALVDELVIAKNGLAHLSAQGSGQDLGVGRDLAKGQAALERVVNDLHAAVTSLRLVTLGHLFSRFPRQVREIAKAVGKDVELLIGGEQVAVDKTLVEGLYEPLLHLVRNAIDHGLEAPDARRAGGKRARATLTLAAQVRGEDVTIDITDDGRGIDVGQVRQTAVAQGIVEAEAAAALSDAEAAQLVFAPGFSTASQVSDLSGRGVGMDAVRAAVARMGGRVELENRPGQGLSVRLSLPAHVVLTKVLVAGAGGERFGAPLEAVVETHRVRRDEVQAVRAGRAFVRREQVIPLLRLSDLLGLPPRPDANAFPVLVVESGGEPVGVQIDEIGERVEAPLRPMSGLLSAFPGVLGTILQGDGQVLLILDLAELAA